MKDSTQRKLHITAWVLFGLYTAVMLYLLIFERVTGEGILFSLQRKVSPNLQLRPFRTIIRYFRDIRSFSINDRAFRNFFGNIVLFIPAGVFLPLLFRKQRRFPVFILTIVGTITAIELIQGFGLLGICDIDDLILNTLSACIGFLIYRLTFGKKKDNKKDESHDPS